MSTITGTTYITDLVFVTTATTEAVLPIVDFDGAPSGVTLQFPISAITTYNLAQNTDELGGTSVRTLFASTTPVSYSGDTDVDILSGGSSNFGSRNLPSSFFSNSVGYLSKKITFEVNGVFGTGVTKTLDAVLKVGSDTINSASIGSVVLNSPDENEFSIKGELNLTTGSCYSWITISYPDSATGTTKTFMLSDITTPNGVSAFNGGDLSLIINTGTTLPMTAYTSLIQIHN